MAVRRRSLTRARVPIATGPSSPAGMTSLAEGHFIVELATSCPRPLRSLPFPGPLPTALVRHPATLTWASCQCRAHHTSQFPAPSPVQDCRALSWPVVAFSAGGDAGRKSPELVHQPAPKDREGTRPRRAVRSHRNLAAMLRKKGRPAPAMHETTPGSLVRASGFRSRRTRDPDSFRVDGTRTLRAARIDLKLQR
jgi:hypothetical protein